MIEIWTIWAQTGLEKLTAWGRTPFGAFLQTALTSIAGIIVLLVFLTMIFSPATLPVLLSGVIVFNAAIAGYALQEKGGRSIRDEGTRLFTMALLLCAAGCLSLFLMYPWLEFISVISLPVYIGFALAATYAGAWLEAKKHQPENNNISTLEEDSPQIVS